MPVLAFAQVMAFVAGLRLLKQKNVPSQINSAMMVKNLLSGTQLSIRFENDLDQ
ncbi:MAG: hypothetical protein HQM13_09280 [SAR324 cluster bacterium]|nr:hypothetical protein [SAR324 cluster bacterium]